MCRQVLSARGRSTSGTGEQQTSSELPVEFQHTRKYTEVEIILSPIKYARVQEILKADSYYATRVVGSN